LWCCHYFHDPIATIQSHPITPPDRALRESKGCCQACCQASSTGMHAELSRWSRLQIRRPGKDAVLPSPIAVHEGSHHMTISRPSCIEQLRLISPHKESAQSCEAVPVCSSWV
jgi:hypothetical protein